MAEDDEQRAAELLNEDTKPDPAACISDSGDKKSFSSKSGPSSGNDQLKKLFIGGLTPKVDDKMLKEFYEQWGGEIVDVVVMRDNMTKKSRGFGFVSYATCEEVDTAMANRPHVIDGKQVDPKRAVPKEQGDNGQSKLSVKKLYVSGIRDSHTEEQIKEHFSQFGNVTEVMLITDKQTGKKRGFGFIQFDDYDAVDKCVLQRSHVIDGLRCDVKKALSKEEVAKTAQKQRDLEMRNMQSRGGGPGMGRGGPGPWQQGGGQWGNQGGGWGQQGGYGGQQSWGNDGGYGGGRGYQQQGGYGQQQGGYGGGNTWGNQGGGGQWGQQQGGGTWGNQGAGQWGAAGGGQQPWGGQAQSYGQGRGRGGMRGGRY